MKEALKRNAIRASERGYILLMNLLGRYSEFYLGAKIVRRLSDLGIEVHIAGNG